MSKQQVSKEEFLAELNRNLREHPGYEDWMQFTPAPEGPVEDTPEEPVQAFAQQPVYHKAGPDTQHSLYELIAMKVGEAFEIFPK